MRTTKIRSRTTPSCLMVSEAFSQLFVKQYPRLCNFATILLHDCEDAREIVTQVFERLWTHKEMLGVIENIPAYLYAAVKTNCMNHRKRSRIRAWHRQRAALGVPVKDDGLLDGICQAESADEMQQLLNELPVQRRRVLQLAYQDGLRNREIAHDLGLSLETVKTHRKIGLAELRVLILQKSGFPDRKDPG